MRFGFRKAGPSPQPPAKPTPREPFEAAEDKDYSKKACRRSLAPRGISLTGDKVGINHAGQLCGFDPTHGRTTPVERAKAWIPRPWMGLRESRKTWNDPSTSSATREADGAPSYAMAAITRAEPGLWGGRKAHFIRLHVEFHPDSRHYLQRAEVHIRLWKAGDAIQSFAQHAHLNLLAIDQPDAHELGDDAPPVVLYAPRAVIGRPAASTTEPYWNGHFKSGDHFVFFGEALPPRNLASAGPQDSSQPRSLLNIAAFGDSKELRPAPHFDVGLVAARKQAIIYPVDSPSPQQLFDSAAADKDYSNEACLRSLASRTVILTGRALEDDHISALERSMENPAATPPQGLFGRLASRFKRLWRLGNADQHIPALLPTQSGDDTHASAVASVSWHGEKAHFVRLHVGYHPDTTHHLETADLSVRVWKAGDALQSFAPRSHLNLLSLHPQPAPELGENAPPIVLYGPRAVVGRAAGSSAEPFWNGHFAAGDHFVYTAEAMPPLNLSSAGPHASKQPRSLLDMNTSGDPEEMRPAPSFGIAFVVLSDGEPFDMTAYSTSVHWGLPAVHRYLFDPYKPAKFGRSTRLIPKGERPIASDFAGPDMKEKLLKRVDWCRPYDTILLGGVDGCVEKPSVTGRRCFSRYCKFCAQVTT